MGDTGRRVMTRRGAAEDNSLPAPVPAAGLDGGGDEGSNTGSGNVEATTTESLYSILSQYQKQLACSADTLKDEIRGIKGRRIDKNKAILEKGNGPETDRLVKSIVVAWKDSFAKVMKEFQRLENALKEDLEKRYNLPPNSYQSTSIFVNVGPTVRSRDTHNRIPSFINDSVAANAEAIKDVETKGGGGNFEAPLVPDVVRRENGVDGGDDNLEDLLGGGNVGAGAHITDAIGEADDGSAQADPASQDLYSASDGSMKGKKQSKSTSQSKDSKGKKQQICEIVTLSSEDDGPGNEATGLTLGSDNESENKGRRKRAMKKEKNSDPETNSNFAPSKIALKGRDATQVKSNSESSLPAISSGSDFKTYQKKKRRTDRDSSPEQGKKNRKNKLEAEDDESDAQGDPVSLEEFDRRPSPTTSATAVTPSKSASSKVQPKVKREHEKSSEFQTFKKKDSPGSSSSSSAKKIPKSSVKKETPVQQPAEPMDTSDADSDASDKTVVLSSKNNSLKSKNALKIKRELMKATTPGI